MDGANGKEDGAGRVILVTGAGSGLGAAFARGWAAYGGRVLVNNRRHPGLESSADAVVAAIRADGGTAVADYHDVADEGAATDMVRNALAAFGRLDALILNAGTSGRAARVGDLALAELRAILDTNFLANVALVQAALPHLARSGSGRILFISSSAGLYGVKGRSAYAASKGALNAFALSLAAEQRRAGIGVNILAPYAATRMTADNLPDAIAAIMQPERVVPLAIRLTSADHHGTGEILVAGGGVMRTARAVEGAPGAPDAMRGFPDAEAAFADLLRESQARVA